MYYGIEGEGFYLLYVVLDIHVLFSMLAMY